MSTSILHSQILFNCSPTNIVNIFKFQDVPSFKNPLPLARVKTFPQVGFDGSHHCGLWGEGSPHLGRTGETLTPPTPWLQPYIMSERSSYISRTSLSATSDHIYQSWPHGFVRSYERQVPDRPLSANQLLFLFKRRSIFLLVGNGQVSKMKVWILKDSVFVILRLC